jgi:putative phage-type endonuclease
MARSHAILMDTPADNKPELKIVTGETRDRSTYLGGTDAAAVCGQSRWKTPLQVWAEKTGKVVPEDISEKLPVKLGVKMEQTVCELFMEETGKKLHRVNETLFHPEYDFIGANIDRRVVGEDAGFEAKTTSAWKSKDWEGEDIPQEFIFQCFHYLMVTGKARWYLAVLIGNQDFKIKIIERDEAILKSLLEREVSFWKQYVQKDEMPWMVSHADSDTISKLYPAANEAREITLGDDANQIVELLKAYDADKKNLEKMIEAKKNELKLMMKDAMRATTGIYEIRWINSQVSRLDSDALKEAHPDIHKQFYKVTPMRRFTYKKLPQLHT